MLGDMTDTTFETPRQGSPLRQIFRAVAPWMLLATVVRTFGVVGLPEGMLLIYGSEIVLFVAFLIACQRSIELTGGSVAFSQLGVFRRMAMAKDILWRVALLGLIAHYAAVFAGLPFVYRVAVVYGFDGLAFNRFQNFMLLWGVLIGLLTFLMAVDKARGEPATLYGAIALLWTHWRGLGLAVLFLVPALAVMNIFQLAIGPFIARMFAPADSQALTAGVTIIYLWLFACLRVAGSVLVFTLALKWSWRGQS